MLHSILLDGFRSFEGNVALNLAPLTLLAGPNNVGKSSVIHALLAFAQSEQARSGDALLLSSMWSDLGGFDQVLSAGRPADRRTFSIGLTGEVGYGVAVDALWRFGPPEDELTPASAPILELEYRLQSGGHDTTGRAGRVSAGQLVWHEEFVNAKAESEGERHGEARFVHPGELRPWPMSIHALGNPSSPRYRAVAPRIVSPLRVSETWHVGPFRAPPQPLYTPRSSPLGPQLGRYGEYTAELLFRNRAQLTDVLLSGQDPLPLLSAVNAWWSYVFDGSLALQIDAPARLGYTLAIDTPSAERLGLGQVGLGLSQTLPIVAACLISKPGDLLLVETPEAHLNPGAQHRLANLFIELTRHGRQVVVETHSEHLVNAVRLAVKSGLAPDQVSIVFFGQQDGRTAVQHIELDPHGRALQWPAGFFDQAAIELAELLR